MAITVGVETLDIPVQEELEQYLDQFDKATFRDNKLQSCSPFRYDQHPSFAVHLENGSWIDSGASDEHRKGHFIQLLSFLRQESTEDTIEYLLNKYSIRKLDADTLKVDMSWLLPSIEPKVFSTEDLQPFAFRHPYLSTRGISEEVQREFRVGYCKNSKAIVMPWTSVDGSVINMKFRSVETKRFWYHKEGQRVNSYLYGFEQYSKTGLPEVWLVESEVDCLRLWSNGIPAIAFGTANISKSQEQLLRSSYAEHLVIAVDNDAVGKQFKSKLIEMFSGYFLLSEIAYPSANIKDISDMTDEQILNCASEKLDVSVKIELKVR